MIPLANTQAKISFNYIDKPHIVVFISVKIDSSKIDESEDRVNFDPGGRSTIVVEKVRNVTIFIPIIINKEITTDIQKPKSAYN